MRATESRTAAAPTAIVSVTGSERRAQPTRTATTGFTYAYVETVVIGALARSQTNAM
jgi:hypothetical protein